MKPSVKFTLAVLVATCAAVAVTPVHAQDYPAKPVRLVTGGLGTGADHVSRHLGQRLPERWGKQVVVDNRPAIIAAEVVAKAPPDGYTLLMGQLSSHAIAPSLYKKLAYDPVADFAALTLATKAPLVLVAHSSVPAVNLREFIEYARQRPGAINYAAQSGASNGRLTMILFNRSAGVDTVYVPYKNPAASLTAVLAREALVSFLTVPACLPQIHAGKLKAYAITSGNRFPGAPDIPTFVEAGLPGVESTSWWGVFAPAKTPVSLVGKLNRDIVELLQSPETRTTLIAQGAEPAPGTPEEFTAFIKSEITKWREVIRAADIARQ